MTLLFFLLFWQCQNSKEFTVQGQKKCREGMFCKAQGGKAG